MRRAVTELERSCFLRKKQSDEVLKFGQSTTPLECTFSAVKRRHLLELLKFSERGAQTNDTEAGRPCYQNRLIFFLSRDAEVWPRKS